MNDDLRARIAASGMKIVSVKREDILKYLLKGYTEDGSSLNGNTVLSVILSSRKKSLKYLFNNMNDLEDRVKKLEGKSFSVFWFIVGMFIAFLIFH